MGAGLVVAVSAHVDLAEVGDPGVVDEAVHNRVRRDPVGQLGDRIHACCVASTAKQLPPIPAIPRPVIHGKWLDIGLSPKVSCLLAWL